ncbi:MAG TPA: SDR family NAD(P)-dependent oxidoreductase, partial [Anaerolineales bacterium]|nr:SDR family NAD(P)-dependent oxidoreductase [Anaerolineales bacterium]
MSQTQKDASRKVLVTGGANGFGMETARALLAQGAQVAIGDIDKPQLEKATAELDNPNLLPLELDVSSKTSVQASVAACKENFGGLDALVN